MRHDTELTTAIRTAICRNRMTEKDLCRKTGISQATMTRHMSDEAWSLEQIRLLHQFLHFSTDEMQKFFERG